MITSVKAPLQAAVRHYSTETIRTSDYSFQMKRSENIFLNIDAVQCGVGGINSWGSIPLAPYRLMEKSYSYAYRMSAVR
jgi:beta-galactosidase